MTEKEIYGLSRNELRQTVLEQNSRIKELEMWLESVNQTLKEKELVMNEAGSIAEAALKLNGVFEAAEAASQQYIDNIKKLSEKQDTIYNEIVEKANKEAEKIIEEAKLKQEAMEMETTAKCDEMMKMAETAVKEAKEKSEEYWIFISKRLEEFYSEHTGLKEILSIATKIKAE